MAIALPVVLLLLMGLVDFGRVVIQYNSLTNAAREGARFAIVHQNRDLVVQRVDNMMFMGAVDNTGEADFLGYFHQNDDGSIGAACLDIEVGCVAVVQARSAWNAITPIVSFLGPIDLETTTALAVEFVCPNPHISEFDTDAECPRQP